MKNLSVLVLLPILASCGGGGSSSVDELIGVSTAGFDRNATVVNACESDYYREIAGDYDGQFSYNSDDGSQSCQWEVDLQITSGYTRDPNTRTICDLTFNMSSTGGTNEGCADIGTGGEMLDSLASPNSNMFWTNTPWPVDAAAIMPVTLPENAVFPIGLANVPTMQFTVNFDGSGNIFLPAQDDILPEWSGLLVKQ